MIFLLDIAPDVQKYFARVPKPVVELYRLLSGTRSTGDGHLPLVEHVHSLQSGCSCLRRSASPRRPDSLSANIMRGCIAFSASGGCEAQEGKRFAVEALPILGQPSATTEPSEGALNDPALIQRLGRTRKPLA